MRWTTDVAIVGGGVIGCSIAYRLAQLGVRSSVFKRGVFGGGASGATAGVIGPVWHVDPSMDAVSTLGLRSLDLFKTLSPELKSSGVDPQFQQNGILKVATTPDQVKLLQDGLAWQGELGLDVRWLDRQEILEKEPQIDPNILGGVFSSQEGSIHGQLYLNSLIHASTLMGASFYEGMEVIGLERQGNSIIGVRTASDIVHAGHTVITVGPWTKNSDQWLGINIPVRPIKGQRLLLKLPGFLPKTPVNNFLGYAIPQMDGNVLIASTREEGLFDQNVTVAGIHELLGKAESIFPCLKSATLVGGRAGVRPGSPDGIPILGPIPGYNQLSMASGHDQIGVMLSTGTAELMADFIISGQKTNLEAFDPSRFF